MLYKPQEITDVEHAVIEKIVGVRNKLRHNLAAPRRWTGQLSRNTLARAVRASNSIEGYNVSAEDAIAAVEGEEPQSADRESWLAVTGYRTAMTFVLQLARDRNFIYNEGFIRGLHFMMVNHDLSKRPGNWRPGTIYVREEANGQVVYEAPEAEMVAGLVSELVDYLNEDSSSPALIKGAMAHLNLLMVHPFSDGNGRMARCLQTLVLAREGILEPEFCSIEEYLGRNRPAYYEVLLKTGGGSDTGPGSWRPRSSAKEWIRFNLTAHYRQAQTLLNRFTVMDLLWQEMEVITKRAGLPERVLYAITDAAIGYRVRNSSYRHLASLGEKPGGEIYASRDLKSAVDAGLLIAQGERRGRIYTGSPEIRAIFERLQSQYLRPIADPFKPEQLTFAP